MSATLARIKEELRSAELRGLYDVIIDGERWLRDQRCWVKQYSWLHDPHRIVTLKELGIGSA